MGRPKRAADGGLVYHVLNRANARMTIFENDDDDIAFEQVLLEAVERTDTRLLAYTVMPKPLAFRRLAAGRRGIVAVRWLAYVDAYPALARPPSKCQQRACLSGAIQVVPGSGRRPLLHALPLRRAERVAGQAGEAGRGLALEQPVSLEIRHRAGNGNARPPGAAPPARLAGVRQHAANRSGIGGLRQNVQRGSPSATPPGTTKWPANSV